MILTGNFSPSSKLEIPIFFKHIGIAQTTPMNVPTVVYRILLGLSALLGLAFLIAWMTGNTLWIGPLLSGAFVCLALAVRGYEAFKGFGFALWIFASVAVSMSFPQWFTQIGSLESKALIVPLLQIIMFGMGTTMSLNDFVGVVKMPKAVIIGLVCQFTIMPIVGFSLAFSFGFDPAIAAGIILVGSSPSGLASNVMAYIAKANLALSITLTAVATLLSPLMTPLLMKLFAGTLIEVDPVGMMFSILKMVIIPIILGLAVHHLLANRAKILEKVMPIVSMVGIVVIIAIITALGRDNLLQIGPLLILACLIHNLAGYGLGYSACKVMGMDESSCRTIALEVGLQNGGMASGIAAAMDKVATLGLAPAVFGPMMNITGSTLANFWRTKPVDEVPEETLSE